VSFCLNRDLSPFARVFPLSFVDGSFFPPPGFGNACSSLIHALWTVVPALSVASLVAGYFSPLSTASFPLRFARCDPLRFEELSCGFFFLEIRGFGLGPSEKLAFFILFISSLLPSASEFSPPKGTKKACHLLDFLGPSPQLPPAVIFVP